MICKALFEDVLLLKETLQLGPLGCLRESSELRLWVWPVSFELLEQPAFTCEPRGASELI